MILCIQNALYKINKSDLGLSVLLFALSSSSQLTTTSSLLQNGECIRYFFLKSNGFQEQTARTTMTPPRSDPTGCHRVSTLSSYTQSQFLLPNALKHRHHFHFTAGRNRGSEKVSCVKEDICLINKGQGQDFYKLLLRLNP